MKTVYLIGNPNTGKTSLFNALTGRKERVGNWPGITVEKIEGYIDYTDHNEVNIIANSEYKNVKVIDLPGIYSLVPITPEEQLVKDIIDDVANGIVVNVVDASNLERNLFLTLQLLELGINFILVLNCYDELLKTGAIIDIQKLSKLLNCAVVATVAKTKQGIDQLKKEIFNAISSCSNRNYLNYVINNIQKIENSKHFKLSLHSKWINAIQNVLVYENKNLGDIKPSDILISIEKIVLYTKYKDEYLQVIRHKLISEIINKNECEISTNIKLEENLELVKILPCKLAEDRYTRVHKVISECLQANNLKNLKNISPTNKLDKILLHRIWGLPIFAIIMAATFWVTFSIGSIPSEYIKDVFRAFSVIMKHILPEGMLRELITDGIISGLSGVFVFFPNIIILYVFLVFLEDSGYLARVAFLTDYIMQKIGLHGRAFVPFLMSYGCNVPAVIATRIIENSWQRKLAMLLVPMISCSARLPIMVLLVSAFFPLQPALMLFIMYTLNLFFVFIIGKIASKIINVDKQSIFLLEMPPYRLPSFANVFSLLVERLKHFVEKAGSIILFGSIIIWVLTAFPRNPILSRNYDAEIENINKIYANNFELQNEMKAKLIKERDAEIFERRLMGKIGKSIEVIVKPLGITWREAVSLVPGVLAKESILSTLSILYSPIDDDLGRAMQKNGIKKSSAFSFMILSLFYVPCLSTLGVLYRESNSLLMPILIALFSFCMSWLLAFILFQSLEIFHKFTLESLVKINIYEIIDVIIVALFIMFTMYFAIRRLIKEFKGDSCNQCKFKKISNCNKEYGGNCD